MTREHAKQLLPLIQAFAEGKIIQLKYPNGIWVDCGLPGFSASPTSYRIKPKPKEFWIVKTNDGHTVHYNAIKAENWFKIISVNFPEAELIHTIEII